MPDYLEWKKSYLSSLSYPSYRLWANRFEAFLAKDPREVTLEDVGRFKQYLKEIGYAPKNIQYGLSIIRDYIEYLITAHGIRFPLKLLKIKTERSKSHYAITEKEYLAMEKVMQKGGKFGIQRYLMLRLLWETGVRVGELLSIRISTLLPCEAEIQSEKTTRNRLIGWSPETERLLQIYLDLRKTIESREDYLFVSFFAKPVRKITSRHVQRLIKEAAAEAGLKNKISPHSFRHGFVHRQLDKGRPITTIAQMLGHSTSLNVLTYSQLSSLEIRNAWKTA